MFLSSAGRVMRQRNDSRFETGLVTCRQIHVAKLCMGGHQATPGTHRNKRAVLALVPRVKLVEPLARALAPRVETAVDMPRCQPFFAREPRAGIQRAVRPNRLSIGAVDVARAVMDAVRGLEP